MGNWTTHGHFLGPSRCGSSTHAGTGLMGLLSGWLQTNVPAAPRTISAIAVPCQPLRYRNSNQHHALVCYASINLYVVCINSLWRPTPTAAGYELFSLHGAPRCHHWAPYYRSAVPGRRPRCVACSLVDDSRFRRERVLRPIWPTSHRRHVGIASSTRR